jgi:hypothetical protein
MVDNELLGDLVNKYYSEGNVYRSDMVELVVEYEHISEKNNKLTKGELRDQFEDNFMGGISVEGRKRCSTGVYMAELVEINWLTYLQCAILNDIIK